MDEQQQFFRELMKTVDNSFDTGKIDASDMKIIRQEITQTINNYLQDRQTKLDKIIVKNYQKSINKKFENLTSEAQDQYYNLRNYLSEMDTKNQNIQKQIIKNQKKLAKLQKEINDTTTNSKMTELVKVIGYLIMSMTSTFLLIFIGSTLWHGGIASIWNWFDISGWSWISALKVIGGLIGTAIITLIGIALALFPTIIVDWLKIKFDDYKSYH